jgi:hypothetical protein
MAEDGFDYSALAREGEVKKTKPDALTPQAAKPGKGGKHPMAKPAGEPHHPSDLPPTGGIIQRRQRDNVTPPIPSGTQQDIERHYASTNSTRRGRTPLNGVDQYIQDTLENGGNEPHLTARNRALRYLHARSDGIVKAAEKRTKRQKPPTEH